MRKVLQRVLWRRFGEEFCGDVWEKSVAEERWRNSSEERSSVAEALGRERLQKGVAEKCRRRGL